MEGSGKEEDLEALTKSPYLARNLYDDVPPRKLVYRSV